MKITDFHIVFTKYYAIINAGNRNQKNQQGGSTMGIYLNPNNKNFQKALNSEIYVDKSGLIETTNKRLNTENCNICVSRPRRFGKSVNLAMLSAYYSRGCDSKKLFDRLSIAKKENYLEHLNKYNVIYINMQEFLSNSENIKEMLLLIRKIILKDLKKEYPDMDWDINTGLSFHFSEFYEITDIPFVILYQ